MPTSPKTAKRQSTDYFFRRWSICLVIAAAVLYSIRNAQYKTGIFNDDAVYVLGARSVSHGLPFQSLLLRPDFPLPGIPLILAPWVKFASPAWTGLEWIAVLTTVLTVILFVLWGRRWLTPKETLLASSLFAFNSAVAKYSGILMPSSFYTIAVIGAYLLMDEYLERPTWGKALGLGVLLGWASLVRPEGVVLLVSIAVPLAFVRKGRRYLPFIGVPIVLWGVYLYHWFRVYAGSRTEYGGDVAALIDYWTHNFGPGLLFVGRLLHAFLVTPIVRIPFPTNAWQGILVVSVLGLLLSCVAMGFRVVWRKQRAHRPVLMSAVIFCALYFGAHLFWHVAQPRYGLSLLPFVAIFLACGISELFSPLKQHRLLTRLAIVLIFLSYTYRNGQAAYIALLAPDPMNSPPWHSLAWIREHTAPNTKIISNIASNVELFTDRPSIYGVRSSNPEMFRYRLLHEQFDYIVYRDMTFLSPDVAGAENPNVEGERMRLYFSRDPRHFTDVFEDRSEKTHVYQIISPPGFMQAYETFGLAFHEYENGHMPEAMRLAQQALELDPTLGSARNLEGAVYMRQNNPAAAEKSFLKALGNMPDGAPARLNLATLYRAAGQTQRSDVYVQQALNIPASKADQAVLNERVQALQKMWAQHTGIIYIDAP